MKYSFIFCGLILTQLVFAQAEIDSTATKFSGYLETYFGYDFGQPVSHTKAGFMYSHNRNNEWNVNLGFIKAAYTQKNVRANLTLATGTYMNANLAAESGVLKNIYEANVGVKIGRHSNVWVDAGIFGSHIGFESAIGKDCWTLTRSILADNSPYYESGFKITYISKREKWLVSGLLLNGWQRIQRVEGNNTPAFGHQITYKPNAKVTINSSSFIGNDKPDSVRQMRYFHNLYGIFQLNKVLAITAGFDIGTEQKAKGSRKYNTWYTPIFLVRVCLNTKNSLAARFEYYKDAKGVIVNTGTINGFNTWGYSINYDYSLNDKVLWRIEGRGLTNIDPIFINNDQPSKNNCFITSSLAISL